MNTLIDNSTVAESVEIITAIFFTMFVITIHIGYVLADSITNVDIPSIVDTSTALSDQIVNSKIDEIGSFENLISSNLGTNLTETELKEKLLRNANCVHYLITHGTEQTLKLVTLFPNYTVHTEAVIDENTSREVLDLIIQRFDQAIANINGANSTPMPIKLSILVKVQDGFFTLASPFLPLINYLVNNTWSLHISMQDMIEPHLFLQNVASSLTPLYSLIVNLTDSCYALENRHEELEDIINDEASIQMLIQLRGTIQFLRYLESIYSMYDPTYESLYINDYIE